MSRTTTGTLPVPGASIHYEVTGDGPPLLVVPGGDGGAALTAGLVARLAAGFAVLTYDRRGLPRSTPDDPAARVPIATHADDAYRLLDAVAGGPAHVFGSSFGALVGLTLAAAHPEAVRTLVAHDPATPRLLAPDARARADRELDDLAETYARAGTLPALRLLGRLVAAGGAGTEPGVAPPGPPGPERLAALDRFFARDLPEIRTAPLDAAAVRALEASGTRVVPASGIGSRTIWNHDCAAALAALLGTDLVEFPGGHSLSTHPSAFAARLCEVLRRS